VVGEKAEDTPEQLSLPLDQWDEIAEKTRRDYLQGFEGLNSLLQNQEK